jgi:uncharacterized Tic20 family protein
MATAFSIICGFPLMFAGLKTGFFSLWKSNVDGATRLSPKTKAFLNGDVSVGVVSTVILAAICGIACKCTEEDVGFVIGIIGAVLGTGVVYIIPALLNTRLLARVKDVAAARPEKQFNHALIAVGVVFAVMGFWQAIAEHYPGLLPGSSGVVKVHLH